MRKSQSSGSQNGRRKPDLIQRDISQLRAWAKKKTKLELIMHGEVCGSRYLGEVTEKSLPGFEAPGIFEFDGRGVTITFAPNLWSRAELSTTGEKTVLDVYGKRDNQSLTIEEFQHHGPATANFRKVSDQLMGWSRLGVDLRVSFFAGPSVHSFLSQIRADGPNIFSFGFSAGRSGYSFVVDISGFDLMWAEITDREASIDLVERATGTRLQISDAVMGHPKVLEQFQSGTA